MFVATKSQRAVPLAADEFDWTLRAIDKGTILSPVDDIESMFATADFVKVADCGVHDPC